MSDQKVWICRASHLSFDSLEAYQDHLKTDFYRTNLKRKTAGLPPLSREQFEDFQAKKSQVTEKKKKTDHLKDKGRKDKRQMRQEKHERKRNERLIVDHSQVKRVEKVTPEEIVAVQENGLEEIAVEGPKTVDELVEEQIRGKVGIPVNRCLFDSHECESMEANLSYMRRKYGFNLPMEQYLHDKEGLLTYLGEKIGIGHFSIWDEKHFGSERAVQQHMRDTGTCKMLWEENEDEYAEFYDLESLWAREEEMADVRLHENGYELVINDRKVIGHRDLKIFYQQRVRNTDLSNVLQQDHNKLIRIEAQKRTNVKKKDQQRRYKNEYAISKTMNNQKHYRPSTPLF